MARRTPHPALAYDDLVARFQLLEDALVALSAQIDRVIKAAVIDFDECTEAFTDLVARIDKDALDRQVDDDDLAARIAELEGSAIKRGTVTLG